MVRRVDSSLLRSHIGEEARSLAYMEGEVIEVGEGGCVLRTEGGLRRIALHPDCPVFVNGRRSILWAMEPVAPEAFFWAGIWSRADEAAAIEAVYSGGELMVLESSPGTLTGWSPEMREVIKLPVRTGRALGCLQPGQGIYVLLDLEGCVRWAKILVDR